MGRGRSGRRRRGGRSRGGQRGEPGDGGPRTPADPAGILAKRPDMRGALCAALLWDEAAGLPAPPPDPEAGREERRSAERMERMGLLSSAGERPEVTDAGRAALAASMRGELERDLTGMMCVYLPELAMLPPSLAAPFLEGAGYEPAPGGSRLVWARPGAPKEDVGRLVARCGAHRAAALAALRAAGSADAASLHRRMAASGTAVGRLAAGMMMEELAASGRVSGEGGVWSYDPYWRVHDTVDSDHDAKWGVDRALAALEGADAGAVRGALQRMASEGLLVELSDGVWEWRREGADQVRTHAVAIVKERALAVLGARRSGADPGMIEGIVHRALIDGMGSRMAGERKAMIAEAMAELVSEGKVEEREGMYYLGGRAPEDPAAG